jgi:hypothetical protein
MRRIDDVDSPPVGDVPEPRRRDPRDAEDSKYREAYRTAYGGTAKRPFGRPLRAAFYAYLPDVPLTRNLPADFARNYLRQIHEVQEMQCWSRRERERLRVLERRWARRVRGVDARYNAHGTAPGRRPAPNDRIATARAALEREGAKLGRTGAYGSWKTR